MYDNNKNYNDYHMIKLNIFRNYGMQTFFQVFPEVHEQCDLDPEGGWAFDPVHSSGGVDSNSGFGVDYTGSFGDIGAIGAAGGIGNDGVEEFGVHYVDATDPDLHQCFVLLPPPLISLGGEEEEEMASQ